MSKNIVTWVKLPLFDDIIAQKVNALSMKSNKNNILAMIPRKEKDRVLGFITKNPNLMTRQYSGYIDTEPSQRCPYCKEEAGNIIIH